MGNSPLYSVHLRDTASLEHRNPQGRFIDQTAEMNVEGWLEFQNYARSGLRCGGSWQSHWWKFIPKKPFWVATINHDPLELRRSCDLRASRRLQQFPALPALATITF